MNMRCSNCGVLWDVPNNASTTTISRSCPDCGGLRYVEINIEQKIKAVLFARDKEWIEAIDSMISRAVEGIKATTDGYWRGYWYGIKEQLEALKSKMGVNNVKKN
jgi:predicted  nucleic acid-binding Zn-ribbon protein